MAHNIDPSKYFASLDTPEFLPLLFERIDAYYNHVMESGLLALWRASHMAAHSGWYVGGRMNDAGPNGKFSSLEANDYRNLATHVLNMITTQKSQPEAQARNMDHASQQQTIIANGLAETISDDHDLESVRQDVNEKSIYYGEGWVLPLWNRDLGEIYTVEAEPQLDDNGQPVLDETGQPAVDERPRHTGDLEFHALHPLDVVRDATKANSAQHRWFTTRGYANRFDLMALYPKYADQISKLPSAMQSLWDGKRPRLWQWMNLRRDDCDDVAVWTFMHEKTPACQSGRIVTALAPDLALVDDALPYRELPHTRCAAGDIEGTVFGYSLFFDLLALQQGLNAGVSAIATRMAAFALPTVTGSPNTKLENLGDGMTCLTYSEGEAEPKLLDFAAVPPGLVEFVKMLRDLMATYSGINNVARGQPEGGITAASALALLEARAIQFVALSQKADIRLTRRMFTTSLHHIQDHAVGEVVVRMSGQGNKTRVETFQAQEKPFGAVEGYRIEIGNALQTTNAGRLQLAEGMKASGVPMRPEDYIQVATTGRLDPITQGPQKELELIAAENEALSRGQPIRALVTDSHPLHVQEHTIVVADISVRADPNSPVILETLSHIQEHKQLMQSLAPPPLAPVPGPDGKVAPPPQAAQAGGPAVKTETAQPARNPLTGAPNAHPAVAA